MNIYIDEKSLDDIIAIENFKITKEGEWFVSEDLNTGIASQGSNYSEAVSNLKEALELYNQK